jgi:hypothetical protein
MARLIRSLHFESPVVVNVHQDPVGRKGLGSRRLLTTQLIFCAALS